jgi:predicted nucleic acid-binding protein
VKAFVDSDVLIWHLRGKLEAYELLKRLRDVEHFELWTGAMQRAEVVFFMRDEEEKQTLLFLSQFQTAPVEQGIVDHAGSLYRQWNPSDGMDVNDAILAATAIKHSGRIYTLNTKHYPISDNK